MSTPHEQTDARLRAEDTDLLVLPEMALTGYMFGTPEAVRPHLEPAGKGPTALLAAELAARLQCVVVAGYPEALPSDEAAPADAEGQGDGDGDGTAHTGIGYNSAVVAGPSGVVGNYRKTFLFETDKVWCRPGAGFAHFDLEGVGRVALGICMGESSALAGSRASRR